MEKFICFSQENGDTILFNINDISLIKPTKTGTTTVTTISSNRTFEINEKIEAVEKMLKPLTIETKKKNKSA